MTFMRRLLIDERGQDLVEYVLLGATIAIAAIVGISAIGPAISAVYASWDAASQGLWYPPDPN
jgi:Flp pilus assembly pilin Flp